MVLPVYGLGLPLHLKLNLFSAVAALRLHIDKAHFHGQAAPFCKDLLYDAL